jgi:chromosome segregation ATPase
MIDQPAELHELLNEMQSLQANQEEEMDRLRRRLTWLEGRRREFYEIISHNSADLETRRKLEDVERQHDDIQALLAQADQDLKRALREIRERILNLRNEELTRIEQEIKALRARRDEIRNQLLPEVMARAAALQEEDARLTARNEELLRRSRSLDAMDLPTSQVA